MSNDIFVQFEIIRFHTVTKYSEGIFPFSCVYEEQSTIWTLLEYLNV